MENYIFTSQTYKLIVIQLKANWFIFKHVSTILNKQDDFNRANKIDSMELLKEKFKTSCFTHTQAFRHTRICTHSDTLTYMQKHNTDTHKKLHNVYTR